MDKLRKNFVLILFSPLSISLFAQTVQESEPNNYITSTNVITINSIGNYHGQLEWADNDYWKLPEGASSIDLNFSNTNFNVIFVLKRYRDNYSIYEGYQQWQGGAEPSLISLDPAKYYAFLIFNQDYVNNPILDYTIFVEDGVLPVELTSFYSQINENSITLNWNTASEVKNYGFEIERKLENENWSKIGFVQGAGNSNSPKSYSFTNKNVTSGVYLYRLKQIDTDGSYEYSKEIKVTMDKPTEFLLKQNFPNPFNPTTKIKYSIPASEKVLIKVYDVLGRELKTLLDEYKDAGTYEIEFNANKLTSGLYFYKITAGNNTAIRKMLLVR